MDEVFGKVVTILLMVCLLFVAPYLYAYQRMCTMEELFVTAKTIEFVDAVRNTGVISRDMLTIYERNLQTLYHRYTADYTQLVYGTAGSFGDTGLTRLEYDREDIVKAVYEENEEYVLRADDYFKVTVVKKAQTGDAAICVYGGYIHNERY